MPKRELTDRQKKVATHGVIPLLAYIGAMIAMRYIAGDPQPIALSHTVSQTACAVEMSEFATYWCVVGYDSGLSMPTTGDFPAFDILSPGCALAYKVGDNATSVCLTGLIAGAQEQVTAVRIAQQTATNATPWGTAALNALLVPAAIYGTRLASWASGFFGRQADISGSAADQEGLLARPRRIAGQNK